tara:strand:+ start:507 stop:1508 length:1002 start_codon:yes stop_codon:yes gene_type:complete
MNHYATLNEHGLHPSRMLTELCVTNDSGKPKFPALPEAYNYEPVFADLYYDVEFQSGSFLVDQARQKVSDRRGLINPNNGHYIGTVGHRHVVHNFNTVYSQFTSRLEKSDLDFRGSSVKFVSNADHSNLEVWVDCPSITFNDLLGEESHMLIRLRDSHNQSAVRSISAEIIRDFCLNGCVWASKKAKEYNTYISEMHTKSARPVELANSASRFPVMLAHQAEQIGALKNIAIKPDDAFEFFKRTLCATVRKGEVKTNEEERKRCVEKWDKYHHDGNTLWRAYNVLTDFSTHIDKNHHNPVVKREQNRSKVRSALQDKWFKSLLPFEIADVDTV